MAQKHGGLSRGYDQDKGAVCLQDHAEPCWKPTLFDCLRPERKGWGLSEGRKGGEREEKEEGSGEKKRKGGRKEGRKKESERKNKGERKGN